MIGYKILNIVPVLHSKSLFILCVVVCICRASQVALVVKNLPANSGDVIDAGSTLGQEDPLEEGMTTHSTILAWKIPWTEKPDGLQFMGSQRVGHN